jgi:uncharacterized delta-60 repeat protein
MLLAPFFRGFARSIRLTSFALTAFTVTAVAQTNTPSADDGFDPNVDGNVYAIVTQGDGKMLIAGQFSSFHPNSGAMVPRDNLARLNADGTVDPNFSARIDGAVRAVVVQLNKKIIIGGDFTHIDGTPCNYIARLNEDGSVDPTFTAGVGSSLDPLQPATKPQVLAVAVQPNDGSVVVGGSFASATASNAKGGLPRKNLVRFLADGTLDTKYDPNPNGVVLALAPYSSNRMLVAGGFTQLQPAGDTAATTRGRLVLLTPDGKVDPTFGDAQADNAINTMAVQTDGKILIGGYFANAGGSARSHLARLNADGSLDGDFAPVIGGNVFGLGLANDGAILVGGTFSQVYGRGVTASRSYAARFAVDGTPDSTFNPGVNGQVNAFGVQADDKIVIGGYFTRAQPTGVAAQIIRNRLARVLPTGSLDAAFQLDPGGRILTSIQVGTQIIIGGSFTNVGGVTHNHVARLNADGTVDNSYNPDFDGTVYTLVYQNKKNEDRVVVGGAFTNVNGTPRNHIARLINTGALDTTFDPSLDGPVATLAVQNDSSILVGGQFTTAQPQGQTATTARANLLRLTKDGQLDTGFNPTPNAAVVALGLQSNGQIVIGGDFTVLDPNGTGNVVFRNFLARLNADGSVDPTYNPNPNAKVNALVIQSDDSAIVGGQFADFVPPGATALVQRFFLARIKSDGSVDAGFNPQPNSLVLSLALQSDGKILIGGAFTSMQPTGDASATTVRNFVRLTTDGKIDSTLSLNPNEQSVGRVDSITVLNDDSFVIGGTFVTLQPVGTASPQPRNHFARLTKSGQLDPLNPGASGGTSVQVNAIALQSDGKVLVAGNFSDLGGAKNSNLARFNPEGGADTAFNAALSTNGPVNALAIRPVTQDRPTQLSGFAWFTSNGTLNSAFTPTVAIQGTVNTAVRLSDNSIVLGGAFSDLSGQTAGNLMHLKADGTLDPGFSVKLDGAVNAIVVQSDGKLVIGGTFTMVGTTARNRIARIALDGTLDSFDPNANGVVSSLLLQSNGSIVLGGSFTSLTPNGTTVAITRNYVARVKSDGSNDDAFDPNLNGAVNSLARQTINGSESIVIGGAFTTVAPPTIGTTTRNRIARFNSDGSLDAGFDPNANGAVFAVAVQAADGSVLLGGAFTTLQPNGATSATPANHFARVLQSGAIDPNFTPSANDAVTTISLAPDGAIVIGGAFTSIVSGGAAVGGTTAVARNHIARLSATGVVDQNFNPSIAGVAIGVTVSAADSSVLVNGTFSSLQPNGTVLIGGSFSVVGGLAVSNLALLNADGSVDSSFLPNPNGAVNAVLALPDRRFVVGGAFTNIATQGRAGLALFTASGTLDSGFAPSVSGTVTAVALEAGGTLIVGADRLTRIGLDGSIDPTFNPAVPAIAPVAIAIQSDGKIVVAAAGSGVPVRVFRLNADGSADTTFTTVTFSNGAVRALTLQADGSIIIAGSFTNLATDTSGAPINYLARLTPTGAIDKSFNPNPAGTGATVAVSALALQSDGRLFLGGSFTMVGSQQRVGIARIGNTAIAPAKLSVSSDGTTVTWLRSGTAAEAMAVSFERWNDTNKRWDLLPGTPKRLAGSSNWQLSGQALPTAGSFSIRARAIVPGSAGKSTGMYETIRLINLSSPVAGTARSLVPISAAYTISDQASHYAWTYDAATGAYQTIDVLSGALVDSSKTIVLDPTQTSSTATARLADLSTRGDVTSSSPLIGGFVIAGAAPRTVLIRAVGPGLLPFGVTNFLPVPRLTLFNNDTGAVLGANAGWGSDPALSAVFVQVGAFPLAANSTDSVLLVTLQPGTYSAQVSAAPGTAGGNVLIEVYDAGNKDDTTSRLVNLSSRGTIAGDGTITGGLVIAGDAPKRFLVRGVGVALARFGVDGGMADPKLAVYDANGRAVAANDDWSVSAGTVSGLDVATAVANAATSVGAFQLDPNSKDAALIVTLPAGSYTVQVTGGGSGGAAMIEVYQLP